MNPLPNEWTITHRADTCAATHRPFIPGEYFYTLLYHGADGYRREDLSEEAWRNRNENIQPFSFWKSRYEPLPPKPPEPLLYCAPMPMTACRSGGIGRRSGLKIRRP